MSFSNNIFAAKQVSLAFQSASHQSENGTIILRENLETCEHKVDNNKLKYDMLNKKQNQTLCEVDTFY